MSNIISSFPSANNASEMLLDDRWTAVVHGRIAELANVGYG